MFFSRWRLTMTKDHANIDEVERLVAEGLKGIDYQIRSGLIVTVILGDQIRTALYVLEHGQPGFV